jgi:hypothetical protein
VMSLILLLLRLAKNRASILSILTLPVFDLESYFQSSISVGATSSLCYSAPSSPPRNMDYLGCAFLLLLPFELDVVWLSVHPLHRFFSTGAIFY